MPDSRQPEYPPKASESPDELAVQGVWAKLGRNWYWWLLLVPFVVFAGFEIYVRATIDCDPSALTRRKLLELAKTEMLELGYTEEVIADLTIRDFYKIKAHGWPPQFGFYILGNIDGKANEFTGRANGCGIGEWSDVGAPTNITRIE